MQDQPRRLRSTAVSLGLVGALALSLSACGTPSASATRRCIDETNIRVTDSAYPVVPDAQCVASTAGTAGSFGSTSRYRYYYGGTLRDNYVYGGSFTVPTTRSGSSSSRRWYNPGTWRSSSSSNSSTSSTSSGSSSSTKSGVTTGGFGSSGSSGGKSGSSSS
jgi:hypothetical protein